MNGKNINFGDKTNLKSEFYKYKKIFQIDDIDINKILVSKKEPYGTKNAFKYFIRYNDNDANANVTMSFRVNNKQLLKNYNNIWKKSEKLMRTEFESNLWWWW